VLSCIIKEEQASQQIQWYC